MLVNIFIIHPSQFWLIRKVWVRPIWEVCNENFAKLGRPYTKSGLPTTWASYAPRPIILPPWLVATVLYVCLFVRKNVRDVFDGLKLTETCSVSVFTTFSLQHLFYVLLFCTYLSFSKPNYKSCLIHSNFNSIKPYPSSSQKLITIKQENVTQEWLWLLRIHFNQLYLCQ